MNLVSALFASLRRQRPAVARDFADMGTAFGLDASLDAGPDARQDNDSPATIPAVFMKKGRPESEAPQQRAPRTDDLRVRR